MGLVTRILRGNELRRTRFHDEKGNRVPLAGLAWAPAALASAVLKKLGVRAEVPMISYRARRAIGAWLGPGRRAVEFGSGYSTLWLARRAGWLLSLEDHPDWHRLVAERLRRSGLDHVRYELRTWEMMCRVGDLADASIDFALVDGTDRDRCVAAILPKIRPGGAIYLDNSDKDMTDPAGDLRRAEARLCAAAAERGARIRYFTDFSPTNFFAEQGMLVVFPD
jgi:hypothetical protein